MNTATPTAPPRRRATGPSTVLLALTCWAGAALAGAAPDPAAPRTAAADGAPTLTVARALHLAVDQAPALAAERLRLAASRSAAIPAGELPDPELMLGIEGLPIEGPDRYRFDAEPMTMAGIGVAQRFPNRQRREARVSAAQGRIGVAEARTALTRTEVLQRVAAAWIERHTAERQLAQLPALFAENDLLAAAVAARYGGGDGPAGDVVLPRQERVRLEELQDGLTAARRAATAELVRWIGDAGAAPLPDAAPDWDVDPARLLAAVPGHPALRVYDAEARVLDAGVAEAEAARRPDWGIELGWRHRDDRFGDMVMMRVAMDLPLFAARRQNPEIAARQAERSALTADREAARRAREADLAADLAEYDQLDAAARRLAGVAVPLAEEKVDLTTADWLADRTGLTAVVAARLELAETRLRAIALDGARRSLAARLHYAYADSNSTQEGALP
ncbi:MAG: TolC family protein [Pseudomonadales bacterium]